MAIIQRLRPRGGESGQRMLVVICKGSRPAKLGDGVHDTLTLSPLHNADFILEDSRTQFEKNIPGNFLIYTVCAQ